MIQLILLILLLLILGGPGEIVKALGLFALTLVWYWVADFVFGKER